MAVTEIVTELPFELNVSITENVGLSSINTVVTADDQDDRIVHAVSESFSDIIVTNHTLSTVIKIPNEVLGKSLTIVITVIDSAGNTASWMNNVTVLPTYLALQTRYHANFPGILTDLTVYNNTLYGVSRIDSSDTHSESVIIIIDSLDVGDGEVINIVPANSLLTSITGHSGYLYGITADGELQVYDIANSMQVTLEKSIKQGSGFRSIDSYAQGLVACSENALIKINILYQNIILIEGYLR